MCSWTRDASLPRSKRKGHRSDALWSPLINQLGFHVSIQSDLQTFHSSILKIVFIVAVRTAIFYTFGLSFSWVVLHIVWVSECHHQPEIKDSSWPTVTRDLCSFDTPSTGGSHEHCLCSMVSFHVWNLRNHLKKGVCHFHHLTSRVMVVTRCLQGTIYCTILCRRNTVKNLLRSLNPSDYDNNYWFLLNVIYHTHFWPVFVSMLIICEDNRMPVRKLLTLTWNVQLWVFIVASYLSSFLSHFCAVCCLIWGRRFTLHFLDSIHI